MTSNQQRTDGWHRFSVEDPDRDTLMCAGCGLVLSCKASVEEWQRQMTEPCSQRITEIGTRLLR